MNGAEIVGEAKAMIKILIAIGTLLVASATPIRAAEVLTGKDATQIDWAARNCGVKSTPKEHGLIEAARAKGVTAFEKQYMQQFDDKTLSKALATPGQTRSMCDEIKSWYGASGSRIAGLVQNTSDPVTNTPSAAGAAAKMDMSQGRKHKK